MCIRRARDKEYLVDSCGWIVNEVLLECGWSVACGETLQRHFICSLVIIGSLNSSFRGMGFKSTIDRFVHSSPDRDSGSRDSVGILKATTMSVCRMKVWIDPD